MPQGWIIYSSHFGTNIAINKINKEVFMKFLEPSSKGEFRISMNGKRKKNLARTGNA